MILRAVGVEAKTELENTVSTVELSEMIAESLSEGLLDPEEHNRLSRALQIRNRVVADVAVPLSEVHAVPVAGRRLRPDGRARSSRHWRRPATPGSRSPTVDGRFIGYLHIKDVLTLVDDPDAVVDLSMVRPLPQVAASLPLPDALSRLRRSNSHLALVTADDGSVTAMVALEDLVEDLVGADAATGPTVADVGAAPRPTGPPASAAHRRRVDEFLRAASQARAGRRGRIRCGISCSATTACGRASCGSGIPASAWCSAGQRGGARYLDRSGYGRHPRRCDRDRRASARPCRHRAVHRGPAARHRRPRPRS